MLKKYIYVKNLLSQYNNLLTEIIYFIIFPFWQETKTQSILIHLLLDFTSHSHLCWVLGMEITGVFDSIKGCVGSGYCFGLHLDCYLCHNFVKGRIISKTRLKYDIIFIESCQLSRVSYGTVITMEYFDLNNEWLLAVHVSLLFMFLLVPWRENYYLPSLS